MDKTAQASLGTINEFLEKVGEEEKAALGSDGPTATSEPGSQGGETEHPVKNVDDRLEQPADTGDRFAENSSDAKSDDTGQGAPSVDNTSEAKAKVAGAKQAGNDEGAAADDQLQIGTNVQATGDDPSNETSSTKNTKEDDGYEGSSSHPARTDNDEIDGHKYARDLSGMSLEKLAGLMQDAGNDLCATIAVGADGQQKQAMKTVESEQGSTHKVCPGCGGAPCRCGDKEAAARAELAQQAGWDLAGLLTGDMDKQAADRMVHETISGIIKQASDDADNVIEYLTHYAQTKRAMEDDAMAGAAEAEEESGPMGGEGPPPEAGGEGGEDAMAAALGGGAPPPDAGGAPGGEDPEALLQLLAQLGIPPEQLIQLLQQEGGAEGGMAGGMPPGMGGEGGMPPGMGGPEGAGGMPPGMGGPEGAGGMPPGMEVAAGDNASQHQKNAAMRDYLIELLTRSRQKEAQAQAAAKA
jgi:hypothetical protein